jgi:hypothetical protein
MEYKALTAPLTLMSWALHNFHRKMEDGHCHDLTHTHGETKSRTVDKDGCSIEDKN